MTEQQIYEHHQKDPGEFLNGFICGACATLLVGLMVWFAMVQPR
jgi:hypothetical protein